MAAAGFFRVEIKVREDEPAVVMIGAAKSRIGAARGAVESIVSSERATPSEVAAYVREGGELYDWSGDEIDERQTEIEGTERKPPEEVNRRPPRSRKASSSEEPQAA